MAQDMHQRFKVSDSTTRSDIASALNDVSDDDLSKKSPVTGGLSEVAIMVTSTQAGVFAELRVEGHDGDWSKTSQEAIREAVESSPVVEEHVETTGGYESDSDGE